MCTFVFDLHAVSCTEPCQVRGRNIGSGANCRLLYFPSQAYSCETVTPEAFTTRIEGRVKRTPKMTTFGARNGRLLIRNFEIIV
jgi:hypothetical protein